jgi:glycerol kinase
MSLHVQIYSEEGKLIASHQVETVSHHPHTGWVEQDPMHILATVQECIEAAVAKLPALDYAISDLAGLTDALLACNRA